jgi:hypothetical protein
MAAPNQLRIRLLTMVILSLLSCILRPQLSSASFCGKSPQPIEDAFKNSPAVFIAHAESYRRLSDEADLVLMKTFKGDVPNKILVLGGTDASFAFVPGRNYLVYASSLDKKGRVGVGVCGRTKLIEGAGLELEVLDSLVRAKSVGK